MRAGKQYGSLCVAALSLAMLVAGSAGVSAVTIDVDKYISDSSGSEESGTSPDNSGRATEMKLSWEGGDYVGGFVYLPEQGRYVPDGEGIWVGAHESGIVRYEGHWFKGMRHGRGMAVLPCKLRWDGNWEGDATGEGDIVDSEGGVVKGDVTLDEAIDWSPSNLTEACAVLNSYPANKDSIAIVKKQERRLLRQAQQKEKWFIIASYLSRISKCASARQLAELRDITSRVKCYVGGTFRYYLMPPMFKTEKALHLARFVGESAGRWSDLVQLVSRNAKDERIMELFPIEDCLDLPSSQDATGWSDYCRALRWLDEALVSDACSIALPLGELPTDEEFQRKWRAWLAVKSCLIVRECPDNRDMPFPPALRWLSKPSQSERVLLRNCEIGPDEDNIILEKYVWGEQIEYIVSKEPDIRWNNKILLAPHSVAADATAESIATSLLSLSGLDFQKAKIRVYAWLQSGYLCHDLEIAAAKLLGFHSRFVVLPSKSAPSSPAIQITLAAGEKLDVGNMRIDQKPEGSVIVYPDAEWGDTVSVVIINSVGINRKQDLMLMPPGPPVRRMGAMIDLNGLSVKGAQERIDKWRDHFNSKTLQEAGKCLSVTGDVDLVEISKPLGWPRISFKSVGDSILVYRDRGGEIIVRQDGIFELKKKWGELFEYCLQNSCGVSRSCQRRLLPIDGSDLFAIRSIDWPVLSRKIDNMDSFLNEHFQKRARESVDLQLVECLPQAIADPGSPLREIDSSYRSLRFSVESLHKLLISTANLHGLETEIVASGSHAQFQYEDGRGYESQKKVFYQNKQEGVDDRIEEYGLCAFNAAQSVDLSLREPVCSLIVQILEQRARNIYKIRSQTKQNLPMNTTFRKAIKNLLSKGVIRIEKKREIERTLENGNSD